MNTIGTKDIKLIHEKVLSLRGNINYMVHGNISYRQLCFVAACSLLDPEVDGAIAANSSRGKHNSQTVV